jgi:hypothetical protein
VLPAVAAPVEAAAGSVLGFCAGVTGSEAFALGSGVFLFAPVMANTDWQHEELE